MIAKKELGSGYLITIWNLVAFGGVVLAVVEGMFVDAPTVTNQEREAEGAHGEGEEGTHEHEDHPEDANEQTPLIRRHEHHAHNTKKTEEGAIGWWIPQVLVATTLPVVIVTHIGIMLLGALSQTLPDPGSPVTGTY